MFTGTPFVTDSFALFDRTALRKHRDRAARRPGDHDFLGREVAARLFDRLADVKRRFRRVLILGGGGVMVEALRAFDSSIETVVVLDRSTEQARQAGVPALAADVERLPIRDRSFDLVLSLLDLHWAGDLPGALVQVRLALEADGLFLGAMLGGATLNELRAAFAEVEIELEGGLSPRVSPFADLREVGNLLPRAGFALTVADADTLTVSYPDAFRLMSDLRGMGETNALIERRKSWSRRATLLAAVDRYRTKFADADGRIGATFEVVYLSGWAPHPSQQQPLAPGSATTRLATALGSAEIPAGEAAQPGKPRS